MNDAWTIAQLTDKGNTICEYLGESWTPSTLLIQCGPTTKTKRQPLCDAATTAIYRAGRDVERGAVQQPIFREAERVHLDFGRLPVCTKPTSRFEIIASISMWLSSGTTFSSSCAGRDDAIDRVYGELRLSHFFLDAGKREAARIRQPFNAKAPCQVTSTACRHHIPCKEALRPWMTNLHT